MNKSQQPYEVEEMAMIIEVGPYDNWVMSESDVPTPLRLCRGHI